MSYRDNPFERRAILDKVLPGYKKIKDAPSRIEDLPGYSPDLTPEELDSFRIVAMAEERKRRYKSVDQEGNIYLVGNPWARVIETREDGTVWVVYPKPVQIMTYAEAKREAARLAKLGAKSTTKGDKDEFDC